MWPGYARGPSMWRRLLAEARQLTHYLPGRVTKRLGKFKSVLGRLLGLWLGLRSCPRVSTIVARIALLAGGILAAFVTTQNQPSDSGASFGRRSGKCGDSPFCPSFSSPSWQPVGRASPSFVSFEPPFDFGVTMVSGNDPSLCLCERPDDDWSMLEPYSPR